MKPENSPENGGLNTLLREWKLESSLPSRFNEQVWRRIARSEVPAPDPLAQLRDWIAQAFMRPAFAVSYAAVLLLLGFGFGLWQARADSERADEQFRARYVQMVDPYQTPRH
jgi:hypothetical protein